MMIDRAVILCELNLLLVVPLQVGIAEFAAIMLALFHGDL